MMRSDLLGLLLLVGLAGAGCSLVPPAFDPASSDPALFDSTHPPILVETRFEVEAAHLNAIVYEAQGPGPHPTVVLLHGFPGNERNLDLAQAIRRSGWNVVFFHYRGAWGSGGEFSFAHVLEDVAAVVDAISAPGFAAEHRIDAARIALVGHSMGGFAALVSGAELAPVRCVASLAGANLGALAKAALAQPEQAAGFATSLDGWSGPIRGSSGAAMVEDLKVQADRFDTTARAGVLAGKPLLLVAGALDDVTPPSIHHEPLEAALLAAGAQSLETLVFERGDHSFSGQRIALARRLTRWLQGACATAFR
ncbi:MAG: alpha/beta hydrolase [Deltaproteobacteria bacterium]|jgi:hypothetical protein|nr:alpha/beta hydrolase [Deltaproteobacteria bacterium]